MNRLRTKLIAVAVVTIMGWTSIVHADPCGMVPPIFTGPGSPITRIGLQQTYVFYKDGVESFVIRPGFQGRVDNFGMLIPFPNPPALRKVPDNVFEQIANAVDPPEVVVDLRWNEIADDMEMNAFANSPAQGMQFQKRDSKDRVVVLKQEAVGMYEVAVLAAGSAKALKKWMDENKFQYPKGMDKVTNEYIEQGWCFVAVKTKVGDKSAVKPKPGQRNVSPEMPSGSTFDGTVQGMGFRFKTDELVVPMRLSAFNEEGKTGTAGSEPHTRNVVYLLTEGPRKIRAIPEEFVVRQLSGEQLVQNLTGPLPLRLIGGTVKDIPEWRRKNLKQERNADPFVATARNLFASDVAAVTDNDLSLEHEETERDLLAVGEHFGLRGPEIDDLNVAAIQEVADGATKESMVGLKTMTLTVVDGDFPRDVLAGQNLKFDEFKMAAKRNRSRDYDTKIHGPRKAQLGRLFSSHQIIDPDRAVAIDSRTGKTVAESNSKPGGMHHVHSSVALLAIVAVGAGLWRRKEKVIGFETETE